MLNGDGTGSAEGLGEKVCLNLLHRFPNLSEAMKRCPAVS